jgi:protein-S-isoprenylcysteine O-methyltransferase Ste14
LTPRLESARHRAIRELIARAAVGMLFVLLSVNLLSDFMRTRHVTGLLLLASEALVVVFTVVRRPTERIDRSTVARVTALVSMVGPPLLRAGGGFSLVSDTVSAWTLAVGLCLVIAGKLTLGRSFGIVAANRGVVAVGPYLFVRHPIYAGYLITHLAFLAANPSASNIAIVLCADTALIARALIEERVLEGDEIYRAYCSRVAWHLVPGVF